MSIFTLRNKDSFANTRLCCGLVGAGLSIALAPDPSYAPSGNWNQKSAGVGVRWEGLGRAGSGRESLE